MKRLFFLLLFCWCHSVFADITWSAYWGGGSSYYNYNADVSVYVSTNATGPWYATGAGGTGRILGNGIFWTGVLSPSYLYQNGFRYCYATVNMESAFPPHSEANGEGAISLPASGNVYFSFGGSNIPPVFTNYTFCAQNTLSVVQYASWYWNGAVVKMEVLQPGQSDCWTSPSVELLPVAENWTENTVLSIYGVPVNWSGNGDGTYSPTFGNTGLGGSSGGTSGSGGDVTGSSGGGGTFTGGTNILSGGNGGSGVVSTNPIIPFSGGLGSSGASDTILQQGFNAVVSGERDLLSGESIINDSINRQTMFVTNALGQIEVYTRSNNDALFQLVRILTNPLPVVVSSSNGIAYGSNVWVQNWPTNFNFGGTNLNQENTQVGISNLLAGDAVDTNDYTFGVTDVVSVIGPTNYQSALDASAAASPAWVSLENTFNAFAAGITGPTVPVDSIPDMTIDFHIPGVSQKMDLNPMHSSFAPIFSMVRAFIMWLLSLYYLQRIIRDIWRMLEIMNSARGVQLSVEQVKSRKSLTN